MLDASVRDPSTFVFRFGRRYVSWLRLLPSPCSCIFAEFAPVNTLQKSEDALFINIASVLHVFDITPPLDEEGRTVVITPEMSVGFLSYPADYRCTIKPRSAEARGIILRYANMRGEGDGTSEGAVQVHDC
ncbi:hypothetical protein DICSQDRAFT_59943 [Dichomitus squalens LYAD-421 SS1]|uniref:Uncharacterized protein n=1 Tax=Dichomitus squalens (strain LYAD-421) TaxID=732165 RepID=R7T002_DICSQ|nr:uncharacterized protein DICSQDRAFT_59943 [Dichomitus squalens LYAD-421 SS1]EJF61754.1 hypothetical protein DICSQDRAFT_59943 [Dichomitus squalens LYAD-421 SS1]